MKNIALLGSGFIAGVHMEGWKRIPGANVVAFFEVVPEKVRSFQEKYTIPHFSSFPLFPHLDRQPLDSLLLFAQYSPRHGIPTQQHLPSLKSDIPL